jgi:hypothetical protein
VEALGVRVVARVNLAAVRQHDANADEIPGVRRPRLGRVVRVESSASAAESTESGGYGGPMSLVGRSASTSQGGVGVRRSSDASVSAGDAGDPVVASPSSSPRQPASAPLPRPTRSRRRVHGADILAASRAANKCLVPAIEPSAGTRSTSPP